MKTPCRKIVGLAGPARCGKDTIAWMLRNQYDAEQFAFAGALKKAASVLLNYPMEFVNGENGYDRESIMPEWGFSMREFLQKLGTECMREQFREDFWINRIRVELAHSNLPAVITDVRFENEAAFVRGCGGVVWHIERPQDNGLDERAKAHASEAGVALREGDQIVINDGTLDDLRESVVALWERSE